MQFESNRMYRVKAVADALDVHKATIYRAIESGALVAYRIGGAVRVPGSAVSAYLDHCTQGESTNRVDVDAAIEAVAEQTGEVA